MGSRHTNDRGDGQAHAHISHGFAAAAWGRHGCGGKVSHGEISAVRHTRDEARNHEDRVIRCQNREQVTHHEEPDEQQDQAAARQFASKGRNQRGTDHHAHRIDGDERGGVFFRNAKIIRNKRQQAHGHELRRADGKRTQGHGHHDDGTAAGGNLRLQRQRTAADAVFVCTARAELVDDFHEE